MPSNLFIAYSSSGMKVNQQHILAISHPKCGGNYELSDMFSGFHFTIDSCLNLSATQLGR